MRFAVQDRLVPGASLRERGEHARHYGFDAIEISLPSAADGARLALRDKVAVSALCGGYRGWLIDPDPGQIALARADLREQLELAGALGAACIVVPIWGRTRNLPGLATGRSREDDAALFVEGLRALAPHAERSGATLVIEPLNRYQNDLCNTVAEASAFRAAVGSTAVKVMGDVFHMNMEETDMAAALTAPGDALAYVHVADNQRLEPGKGHVDFAPILQALEAIRYDGYVGLECLRLSGAADVALPAALSFLRAGLSSLAEGS